ncbi:MAG: hypothetical protein HY329_09705 [Chloroflexi bacterium]|nr:hypothetical protein [Chloroflexota bacterium]
MKIVIRREVDYVTVSADRPIRVWTQGRQTPVTISPASWTGRGARDHTEYTIKADEDHVARYLIHSHDTTSTYGPDEKPPLTQVREVAYRGQTRTEFPYEIPSQPVEHLAPEEVKATFERMRNPAESRASDSTNATRSGDK